MNKKAFTLVELLAVIIIIGLLAAIVVINVTPYINQSAQASYDTLVKTIKASSELYVGDHSEEFPQLEAPGSIFNITLEDLASESYIPDSIVDERTGEQIPMSTTVTITVISTKKITTQLNWE